jgi:hypothetical protein
VEHVRVAGCREVARLCAVLRLRCEQIRSAYEELALTTAEALGRSHYTEITWEYREGLDLSEDFLEPLPESWMYAAFASAIEPPITVDNGDGTYTHTWDYSKRSAEDLALEIEALEARIARREAGLRRDREAWRRLTDEWLEAVAREKAG